MGMTDVAGGEPGGIFLSYRREDASPHARTLQLLLSQRILDVHIFMDLDSIDPGQDFAEIIQDALNSCAVLVALIGPRWATVADEEGHRRLDNPDDYVRFEVKTALERGVRVIPVLVDDAKPLRQQDLPADLHKLARLEAHRLSWDRFTDDADRLLVLIQRVLGATPKAPGLSYAQDVPSGQDAAAEASRFDPKAAPGVHDRATPIRREQSHSDAKVVLDRYRGALLDAAWQLGDRLDNIRHRNFFAYLSAGSGREQDVKLSTLFRFAYYFGWREFVRAQVQLMRFGKEEDTRTAAGLLDDVTWVLASDALDKGWAMLWGDEQRGIGELMTEQPAGTSPVVHGHAAFYRDYDKVFAPWMERFAADLFSSAAVNSDRLRLLQWSLYGLVQQLDEERASGVGWINQTAAEISQPPGQGSVTKYEAQLREHLTALQS